MKKGVIQLDLFDDKLVEVEVQGVRYVLRRNPVRALEISDNRLDKKASKELIHDRYKDLAQVEQSFQTMKTSNL